MSNPSEKIKFLIKHGATPPEAYALVLNEQQREIERLSTELKESHDQMVELLGGNAE